MENILPHSVKTQLVRPPRPERGVSCRLPLSPGVVLLGGCSRRGRETSLPRSRGLGSELCSFKPHTFQPVIILPQRFISRKNWRVLLCPLLQLASVTAPSFKLNAGVICQSHSFNEYSSYNNSYHLLRADNVPGLC